MKCNISSVLESSFDASVSPADLAGQVVELDRRMLDYVVGLDTEFSEIMDGSHLYVPKVGCALDGNERQAFSLSTRPCGAS